MESPAITVSAAGIETARMFERIILPIEPGLQPTLLLRVASSLVERFHSDVILLRCLPHIPSAARTDGSIPPPHESTDELAGQLKQAGAASVQTAVVEGSVAHHVDLVARQHRASLILLPEEPDPTQPDAWFGTNTQKLARWVSTPLLVVRRDSPPSLKPVLCPVEFAESSKWALSNAITIARAFQTSLLVLHVVPEPLPYPFVETSIWQRDPSASGTVARVSGSSGPAPCTAPEGSARAAAAQNDLHEFLGGFDFAGVAKSCEIVCGNPVTEILGIARKRRFGLIVVGAGSRQETTLCSTQGTGETIATVSDVPVMLLRSPSIPQNQPAAGPEKSPS